MMKNWQFWITILGAIVTGLAMLNHFENKTDVSNAVAVVRMDNFQKAQEKTDDKVDKIWSFLIDNYMTGTLTKR